MVKWLGLVVRHLAGKQKDLGSTLRFSSPFSSKIVVYGHCLMTLPCTINEISKRLTSLPILFNINAEIILMSDILYTVIISSLSEKVGESRGMNEGNWGCLVICGAPTVSQTTG